MSIHEKCKLKANIIYWLQNKYGGKKLNHIFDLKNQWLICSYFKDNNTLVIGLAQGMKEARVMCERGRTFLIDISDCKNLQSFKRKFVRLLKE